MYGMSFIFEQSTFNKEYKIQEVETVCIRQHSCWINIIKCAY